MTIRISNGAWGAKKRGRYPVAAKEDRTIDGIEFGSKAEAKRGADLMAMERRGEIEDLRWHPYFEVPMAGQKFYRYTADSSYWRDGKFIVE